MTESEDFLPPTDESTDEFILLSQINRFNANGECDSLLADANGGASGNVDAGQPMEDSVEVVYGTNGEAENEPENKLEDEPGKEPGKAPENEPEETKIDGGDDENDIKDDVESDGGAKVCPIGDNKAIGHLDTNSNFTIDWLC